LKMFMAVSQWFEVKDDHWQFPLPKDI